MRSSRFFFSVSSELVFACGRYWICLCAVYLFACPSDRHFSMRLFYISPSTVCGMVCPPPGIIIIVIVTGTRVVVSSAQNIQTQKHTNLAMSMTHLLPNLYGCERGVCVIFIAYLGVCICHPTNTPPIISHGTPSANMCSWAPGRPSWPTSRNALKRVLFALSRMVVTVWRWGELALGSLACYYPASSLCCLQSPPESISLILFHSATFAPLALNHRADSRTTRASN